MLGLRPRKTAPGTSGQDPLAPPFEGRGPAGAQRATLAAGCFWGVEAALLGLEGVLETAVGYTGGRTPNPTYRQVCGHRTGHAEAVELYFDTRRISFERLLEEFWSIHNPTTRNRQGWDLGNQYRSAIFFHGPAQETAAAASRAGRQAVVRRPIVTEITPASAFYRAEAHHQRYLEKRGRSARAGGVR